MLRPKLQKFASPQEMYEALINGQDLYSPNLETYIFHYSEAGAIAYYSIDPEYARQLVDATKGTDEYWGGHLGPGGYIVDPLNVDEWEQNNAELDYTPIYEFLEDYYKEIWLTTDDYAVILDEGISLAARNDLESPDVITISDNKLRVDFEHIGEGWSGDYNPDDKEDNPLVRYTVSVRRPDADPDAWEQMDDASYCTRIPLATSNDDMGVLAAIVYDRFADVVDNYLDSESVKRLGEELSYLSPDNAKIKKEAIA